MWQPTTTRRPVLSVATRLLNPIIRRFAGSASMRLFALVRHRGRHSGRIYTTLVGARAMRDGVIIPMTFGEGADWLQNVRAAGGCIIQWNGAEYHVFDLEEIDWMTARTAFSRIEQAMIPRLGITQFARLRYAAEMPHEDGPRE
jgi:hypothetical protein